MRAFVVAGTHSGSGKTTVSLGLMAALRRKGLSVQPFKAGPDFIDSGLHKLATGKASRNLDLWMCGEDYVRRSFERHASLTDVSIVEGVMGLYDGNQSTASLARALHLPVVLVVDGYGMAESAGPIVKGFVDWEGDGEEQDTIVKGVIFNRVASRRHYERLRAAVREVPVLGCLPRDLDFEIPHRHLGLMVAEEEPVSAASLERLAEAIASNVEIDELLALFDCPWVEHRVLTDSMAGAASLATKGAVETPRVAVAADKAFCFYYNDNMELLEEGGAQLVFFSPLEDGALPSPIDILYLGGGYPELYAARLSENDSMRTSIRGWADSGGTVYAECGGLMYLSKSIRDFDDHVFEMAGVFPFETVMSRGRARLGYREALLKNDCILGSAGQRVRGHEFHYSAIERPEDTKVERIYALKDGSGTPLGDEGFRLGNVLASYVHVHFGSNPSIARSFTQFAQKGRSS